MSPFDRVVVINLDRRSDRWENFQRELSASDWPFQTPDRLAAVDGMIGAPPDGWQASAGAWGCLRSHTAALCMAGSVLVLEDDCQFADDFSSKVKAFLAAVPADWDGLMLGGWHNPVQPVGALTERIAPGVVRVFDCELTHAYAVRGAYRRRLIAAWEKSMTHCDVVMGRDPTLQAAHRVYAPEEFLVRQGGGGLSDINISRRRQQTLQRTA